MATLLEKFEKKEPHYPVAYEDSIMKRFSEKAAYDQGGVRTEEEIFGGGRFFSRYYECFMYAALIGIKAKYRIPFERNKDGKKFLAIEGWKPKKITTYLFMCMLALSKENLAEMENMDEKTIDEKAYDLMILLEQYAHGGFDLISKKILEDEYFFETPFSIAAFLKTIKPQNSLVER